MVSPRKLNTTLKDAVITAAEIVGEDGKGRGALVGYVTMLARNEPKTFAQLLIKLMPTQLSGVDGGAIEFRRIEIEIVDPKGAGSESISPAAK